MLEHARRKQHAEVLVNAHVITNYACEECVEVRELTWKLKEVRSLTWKLKEIRTIESARCVSSLNTCYYQQHKVEPSKVTWQKLSFTIRTRSLYHKRMLNLPCTTQPNNYITMNNTQEGNIKLYEPNSQKLNHCR
jgi:hypothetical protein